MDTLPHAPDRAVQKRQFHARHTLPRDSPWTVERRLATERRIHARIVDLAFGLPARPLLIGRPVQAAAA